MGAGYRVILAGTLAVLLFIMFGTGLMVGGILAPQRPQPATGGQQPATGQGATNAVQYISAANAEQTEGAHRAKYEAQCDSANEKRDSDLCAQWKAADAAADSARWTYLGNWIGGISGLLVLIAIGLAYQANRIARDTAKHQLRAYIGVRAPKFTRFIVGETVEVDVPYFNHGNTPAYQVKALSWVEIAPHPLPHDFTFDEPLNGPPKESVLMPEELAIVKTGSVIPLTAEHDTLIKAATEYRLYVYGRIEYKDAFLADRVTGFRYEIDGQAFTSGHFGRAEAGNYST